MIVEAKAQQFLYDWLENELWEYLPMEALKEIDDEDTPTVEQVYAQIMGWT